jgi:serine/threonine-protein kinase
MSETPPEAGSGSGRYRTLFELGQGGTANVSLAVAKGPEGFKKLLVVKQLRSVYARDPDFLAMFMSEARLSARLNHPHVVQVYEVFERDTTPIISMEYIEGQTLDAVLALPEPKLPLDLHLRILADVLSGLHYSHELRGHNQEPLNVVHRDVSPHNVMVSYEGVVKVLDFGIAKLSGSTVETEAGVIKGKLRYMPPEQIAGEAVDRRADVFAVGVMMWEALSGNKLWKGLSDATIMNRVLNGQIPAPSSSSGAEIPAELAGICMRALAAERDDRFQSALEMEVALEGYLADRSHYASARELGRFMTDRFASVRNGVERRIESELNRGDSVQPPPASVTTRAPTPSRTGYTSSSSLHASEPQRSKLWAYALLLIAVGVAILFWSVGSERSSPAHEPGSAHGVPSPASTEGAAPLETAAPPAAVASPAAVPVVSAAPAAAGRAGSAAAAPSVRHKQAPRSSAPAPSCDPPYYLDARGIKKFKRECL